MRIKLTILLIGFLALRASAQFNTLETLEKRVDSLLVLVKAEKDPDKRYVLIWSLFNTGVENQPLYFLEVGKKLYKMGQEDNDKIAESSAWSIYGQSYRLTGNFVKAVECHYKAIDIAEKINNTSVLAYALNQLGHIYKDREEFTKALEIYRNAKWCADRGRTPVALTAPLMNLGFVHLALGNLDSALFFSKASLELQHVSSVSRYDWLNYGTMAGAYSKLNQAAEAQKYYALTIRTAKETGSQRNLIVALTGIITHYKEKGQIDSFLYYGRMAVNVVDKTVYEYLRAKPAKMLSDYYENVNADSAIRYLKIFRAANEVMNSTQVSQQIQMMKVDEDQRKAEIALAKKVFAQRVGIGILIAGLLILAGFLVFVSRNNRQKQKINRQLMAQKTEIEETLARLKATQSQLVQSEKMASLGELTAGIAHEIQNPLNFVNNFSEINKELSADLLKEMDSGNLTEARQLAKDIADNSDKINHHGKRADAIVKGMLQHSRTSSGQKEPTEINVLCDEYLRLSYHGLRAKDKSFNAAFETDFDAAVGKTSIQPQEMGRVILNLINNAFYAVNARKKQGEAAYQPKVIVRTRKTNDAVKIIVEDNGTGIPQKVLDKIFQPFFTTKPTGEGTGLGLSLSYDIITKTHGGTLTVESVEGKGTIFTIQIPMA